MRASTSASPSRGQIARLGALTIAMVAIVAAGISSFSTPSSATVAPSVNAGRFVTTITAPGERVPDNTLPVPQQSPDHVREAARDILSRPQYQEPPKTWVDSAKEWIGQRLGDFFSGLNGGAGGPLVWVVAALAVGAVVFLLLRLRGGLGWKRDKADDDPLFVTELEAARSTVEWLSEAERLEALGEWKQALRCRYRSLIGHLIDEGVVRDIPGRTSGEFRAESQRRAPGLAPAFAAASELFDAAWYGDKKTGAEENARFRELASEVTRQSRSRSAKADRDDADRDEPLRMTVGSP